MLMRVMTDFPERLRPGVQLYLGMAHSPVSLISVQPHNQGLVVRVSGVDTPERAGSLRNELVSVSAADRPPLASGQFYLHQLVGLAVVDEADQSIGTLIEVLQTGANDVYVVKRADGSELLLPVIPSVVLAVDAGRRLIRVNARAGVPDESGPVGAAG